MTTTIILNAEGVNALFPEGSEARVALQATVLKRLAEQYIKDPKALEYVTAQVGNAVKQAQTEALKEVGIYPKNYGGYDLNQAAKDSVREATARAVDEKIYTTVKALDLDGEIARQVDAVVASRIREGVRARLSAVQESLKS